MATGVITWSQTASSNSNADSNVNWAEGQAPSSVNDSSRSEMASVAMWRDDIHGVNVTSGGGTSYTLTSNQGIASNVSGFTIQFTPGTTNTGAVTLSVDSNTAKPLRFLTGVDLLAGSLIAGSLYQATYYSSTQEWLLHSFDARPYIIPVGAALIYSGTTSPNSAFVIPLGQAISRTTYATYFSLVGTTYGSGDGSTTFNVPNYGERAIIGKVSSESLITTAVSGFSGATLGATGGSESHTLATTEIPSHLHSVSDSGHTHKSTASAIYAGSSFGTAAAGSDFSVPINASSVNLANINTGSGSATISNTGNTGGGGAHRNVQPSIVQNYILRVI